MLKKLTDEIGYIVKKLIEEYLNISQPIPV
jgi:hypothetical protein